MKQVFVGVAFLQMLFGQVEADAYITYLQSTDVKNNKHFESIYVTELTRYLALFPDATRNKEILKSLADYYYAEDDYHKALFYYLKIRCLYSDYEVQTLNEQITRIMNSEEKSDYENVSENLFVMLPKMESSSLMDDRFIFLERLFELNQRKHYDMLVQEAKNYIRLYPQSINTDKILIMIGKTYERAEDYERALFYYRLLIDIIPTSDQISYVSFQIGLLLSEQLEEFRPAISTFEGLVAADPTYVLSHAAQYRAAVIYQEELEENNKAIEAFEHYLTNYAEGNFAVQSLERISQIYDENKEFDKSIETLRRITKNYATHSDASKAQLRIVEIYEDEQERYDMASAELIVFASLFPNHKDAEEKYFEAIELVVEKVKDNAKLKELGAAFIEKFPNSEYREDVQEFLSQISGEEQ